MCVCVRACTCVFFTVIFLSFTESCKLPSLLLFLFHLPLTSHYPDCARVAVCVCARDFVDGLRIKIFRHSSRGFLRLLFPLSFFTDSSLFGPERDTTILDVVRALSLTPVQHVRKAKKALARRNALRHQKKWLLLRLLLPEGENSSSRRPSPSLRPTRPNTARNYGWPQSVPGGMAHRPLPSSSSSQVAALPVFFLANRGKH